MARHWIHLEQLVGTSVRDSAGRTIGRIEEVHAEQSNGQALITEFILGEEGLLQRLSISDASMLILRWFGAQRSGKKASYCVPWQEMDFSQPHRPKLRCTLEELKRPH